MKKEHFVSICRMLAVLLLLFPTACHTELVETRPDGADRALNEARAKAILELYLSDRAKNEHEKCMKFLTEDLLEQFSQMYGGYVVFHRTDEATFKDSKILSLRQRDDGTIVAEVSVVVEGEGYRHNDAREQYRMVKEAGSWKIDDWQVEYGQADEWPYDD